MSGYCHRITSILPLFVCVSRSSWAIEHTFITFVEESKFDLILFDSRFPRQQEVLCPVTGGGRRSYNVDIGIHYYRTTGTYPCIVLLLGYGTRY